VFAKSGNDPEWIIHKTPREKMFYLASIEHFEIKKEK
jgi:hypothetical protein